MWKTFGLILVIFIVLQMTCGFNTTVLPTGSGDDEVGEYRNTTDNSTRECPSGWIPYGDNCYKRHAVDHKYRKTWQDSLSYCQSIGGDLASFHSQDEERTVLKGKQRNELLWIGLQDVDGNENYVWSDGSNVNYTNWQRGRHYGFMYFYYFSFSSCIISAGTPPTNKWDRRMCDSRYGWICSIPKGEELTTPPPPPPPVYCYQDTNDWIEYEGICYFFSFLSTPKVQDRGWIDARVYCNSQGGELVSIHGGNETRWIYSKIGDTNKGSWWTGLRRYRAENLYKWSDGTALDYENWADYEPNDAGGLEECASAYNGPYGKWNDAHCPRKLPFICKKYNHSIEAITYPQTTPMPGPCPTGWKEFKDRCYSFHGTDDVNERSNWAAARDVCRDLGGDLLTIHNPEIQTFIIRQLKFSTSGLWIGLRAHGWGTGRHFTWTDGSEFEYTNWLPRDQTPARSRTCGSTEHIKIYAGKWKLYECQNEKGFICQGKKNVLPTNTSYSSTSPMTMLCKAGYDMYGDACYKVSTKEETFDQAKSRCITDGGNLTSVIDTFDQAYIKTLLYEIGTPLWIGMTLDKESNEYVWVDHVPVLYTSWSNGDGPSDDVNRSCVLATSTGWNATNCDDTAPSLCKIHLGPVPTIPVHIEGHCGAELEWVPYGSHCYYFGGKKTQKEASHGQFECMKRESHLLTIHHQHENDFIYSQITDANDIWIGLVKGYGGFKWIDDSPFQYSNWKPGEPTDVDRFGIEDCVLMSSYRGDWRDGNCNQNKGFICKKPKIVPTPTPTPTSTASTSTHAQTTVTITNTVMSTPIQNVTQITPRLPLAQHKSKGVNVSAMILVAEAVVAVIVAVGVTVWCVIKKRSNSANYVARRANERDVHTEHNFDNALFVSASPRVDFYNMEEQDKPIVNPS
ncbi:macrophage mannose receptor 1-like isoform X2 [Glandiceps talaboti]